MAATPPAHRKSFADVVCYHPIKSTTSKPRHTTVSRQQEGSAEVDSFGGRRVGGSSAILVRTQLNASMRQLIHPDLTTSVVALGIVLALVATAAIASVPVSADVETVNRTIAPDTVEPGDRIKVSLTVAFDESQSSVSIRDRFDGPALSPSIVSTTVEGTEVSPIFENTHDEGIHIAVEDVEANQQITVVYTVTVDQRAVDTETVSFTGTAGADVRAGNDEANFSTETATVVTDGPPAVSLEQSLIEGQRGQIIAIPLSFENTDEATLELGYGGAEPVGGGTDTYDVRMNVTDTDGDGEVVVLWDTNDANHGNESDAWSATGGEVTAVERTTDGFEDPLQRVQPSVYPVALSTAGEETDLGLVAVIHHEGCVRAQDLSVYHDSIDAVPGFVDWAVTDEAIHLIVNNDTETDYTVTTGSDKRVATFRPRAPDNPTIEVETDCETVNTIVEAQDPRSAFVTAYDEGDIVIRGVTLWKTFLLAAAKLLYRIARLLPFSFR